MTQPTDEDVEQVIAFTGFTDRALIIAALKAKNNNLDQVVNEIFDDKTKFISTYGWDDKAFGTNREGSRTPNSQVPSFAIHTADDGPVIQGVEPGGYYQGQIGAPSRPPSRTNNRSPLSRLVDYTADNATGATLPPTSLEQEDAELQQAIAASVATSNMQSPQSQPQESGVADADTSLPHFGPATRADYDHKEWAMVALNHDKPEPEPSRRKREPGVPAFLRHRSDNLWTAHRLGAILTVLHSIPAARNTLLRHGYPPPQGYGNNPEWWKGKPIVPPAIQATHDAGDLTWSVESKPKWSDELHRLIAFLDATNRSYGTADMLASTQPEGLLSSQDPEKDFFEYIQQDPENFGNYRTFVSKCKVANIHDDQPQESYENPFTMLDFPYVKEQLMMAESLYSLWDAMFFMDYKNWDGDPNMARCAFVTEQAEVLTMRFGGDDGLPKPVEIPQVFYLDRYMAANREEICRIQQHMHILFKALVRAEKAERRAIMCVDPVTKKELSRIDLIQAAIDKMKMKRALEKEWALWRMHEEEKERTGKLPEFLLPIDTPDEDINWTEKETKAIRFYEAKVVQFEDELERAQEKVANIHHDRDRIIRCNQELERRLTVPCEELGIYPQYGYTLRGVANSADILYVCLRAEQDLMEIDGPDSNSAKSTDQWWKLGYVANDDEPVKAEMTTFEKVIEEACGIGSKPILIYASEKAMSEEPEPLSDALQTFIRFDNRLFKQELVQEPPREKKRGGFSSPASPSKRVNRESSADSMATNAASAGDLDDDMRDAPFEAEDPFLMGDDGAEQMPVLVDTSVPEYEQQAPAQPHSAPPEVNGYHDGASSQSTVGQESVRQMANVSLDEMVSRGLTREGGRPVVPPRPPKGSSTAPAAVQEEAKVPEMQERGGAASPFLLQGGAAANGRTGSLMDMELDEGAHEDADDHH